MTSPVTAGTYVETGAYAEHTYWLKVAGWYIWWEVTVNRWFISAVLGAQGAGWFQSPIGTPIGTYTPGGTATGTPVVTYA